MKTTMESNLWRMWQFYNTFQKTPQILSAVVREFNTVNFQFCHRQRQNHPGRIQLNFLDSLGSESEDKVQNNETDFPKASQKLPKEVPFIAIRTFELIKQNPSATVAQLAVEEGVSDRTIKAHIALLKKEGLIERTGGKTKGMWIVIPNKNL